MWTLVIWVNCPANVTRSSVHNRRNKLTPSARRAERSWRARLKPVNSSVRYPLPDPQVKAPVREIIDERDIFGHADRMIEREQEDKRPEANPFRPARDGRRSL